MTTPSIKELREQLQIRGVAFAELANRARKIAERENRAREVAERENRAREVAEREKLRLARTLRIRRVVVLGIAAFFLWIGTHKVLQVVHKNEFNRALTQRDLSAAEKAAVKMGGHATAADLLLLREYAEAKTNFERGPGVFGKLLEKFDGAEWVAVQDLVTKARAPGGLREGARYYQEAFAHGTKVQTRCSTLIEQQKKFENEMAKQDTQRLALYAPSDWKKLQEMIALVGTSTTPEAGAVGFQRALEQLKKTTGRCNNRLAVKDELDEASRLFQIAWGTVDKTNAAHYMPTETAGIEAQIKRADELAKTPDQYEAVVELYRSATKGSSLITARSNRMLAARQVYEKILAENQSDAEWLLKTALSPWQLSSQLADQASNAPTPEKAYELYMQATRQIQAATDAADAARRRARATGAGT